MIFRFFCIDGVLVGFVLCSSFVQPVPSSWSFFGLLLRLVHGYKEALLISTSGRQDKYIFSVSSQLKSLYLNSVSSARITLILHSGDILSVWISQSLLYERVHRSITTNMPIFSIRELETVRHLFLFTVSKTCDGLLYQYCTQTLPFSISIVFYWPSIPEAALMFSSIATTSSPASQYATPHHLSSFSLLDLTEYFTAGYLT